LSFVIGAGSIMSSARMAPGRAAQASPTSPEAVPGQHRPAEPGRSGNGEHVVGQRLDAVAVRAGAGPPALAVPAQVQGGDGMAAGEVGELRGEERAVTAPAVHEDHWRITGASGLVDQPHAIPRYGLSHGSPAHPCIAG
jgi:hypothetical protein